VYSSQASKKAFSYIVEKIHSGEWNEGTRIDTETQLCEKINVSRVAVRGAVEKLSAMSVLIKIQGSGTYVNAFDKCQLVGLVYYPPTLETMITVLEFRKMFDPYNASLFIDNCTGEELAGLEDNFTNMKNAAKDPVRFRSLDHEFHNIIAKGTHNTIIAQISVLLGDLLADYQLALYYNVGPEHAIKYHAMILENIKEKNKELAYAYSKTHIDNAIVEIKKNSATNGGNVHE
jgi:DNA-binding FadR family transcriptional regulator